MPFRVDCELLFVNEPRASEYCLMHDEDSLLSHQPDHVIAIKHGGKTEESNLAWSCAICNLHKGSDLSSVDYETGRVVRLFDPRRNRWKSHFRLEGGQIVPLTAVGRATVYLLELNRPDLLNLRERLAAEGLYPREE